MSAMSAAVSPYSSFNSFSLNSFSILYLAIHSNPRLLLSQTICVCALDVLGPLLD
jgi:hypothetical protein